MKKIHVGRNLKYGLIDPRNQCLRYIGKTHKRREWRLAEHLEEALNGTKTPIYHWIRSLLDQGLYPEVFVFERMPADADWREAEKRHISYWRKSEKIELPYIHPPQTPKSRPTLISSVLLTNIADGG